MTKKRFNITGTCFPDQHYMVDIRHTLDKMQELVDEGIYFTINRGRQYGKTTTLSLLRKRLEAAGYVVFFISFEAIEDEAYQSAGRFCARFFKLLKRQIDYGLVKNLSENPEALFAEAGSSIALDEADLLISRICQGQTNRIVILIDEVDNAGNFDAFLKLLGLLRNKYLRRDEVPAFHSVILAGVYDVKNLKLRLRPEEQHQYNSPWNIAVSYSDDMSLSLNGIVGMLTEYEKDHGTGMDVEAMAKLLRDYTSGYPFLVSRLCMLMDQEKEADSWTMPGFQRAVKHILTEQNTLFDDMIKKLRQFPKMRDILYEILYTGKRITFNTDDGPLNIAAMFGYIYDKNGAVAISNRIMGMRMYNLFDSEFSTSESGVYTAGSIEKSQFIKDGTLDMSHILERFIVHYSEIYGNRDEQFHEKEGRKYFLFYLKPIINGTGNYYVEAETLDEDRMDVVVDYLGQQYVVELKIWRGKAYHEKGEKQLVGYLESLHLTKGYMLTFNFNQKKIPGMKEVTLDGKTIFEAVV
ncbi:MAG: AAA-like domain-containing protein [Lachnospiraceae bacterium]|nr:AAA-like domain-containing protein [Lachnospiraceae bacterium]